MKNSQLVIDGSTGEGGGQILRTALALSAISSIPFTIYNIRSNRKNPGLQSQHLSCIDACAKICNANVEGNFLHSSEIEFYPNSLKFENLQIKCDTAGSTSLIAQTILPLFMFSKTSLTISIFGGTDVLYSPPSEFFSSVFVPFLNSIGYNVKSQIVRVGFYPKGAGQLLINFKDCKKINKLSLIKREKLEHLTGSCSVSGLPLDIAQRMKSQMLLDLANLSPPVSPKIKTELLNCESAGCKNFLLSDYSGIFAGFGSLGEKGKPANKVANITTDEYLRFHKTNACIQSHLADQILIYLSFSEGVSEFTTDEVSSHLSTNAQIISKFYDDQSMFEFSELENGTKLVKIKGKGKNFFKPIIE